MVIAGETSEDAVGGGIAAGGLREVPLPASETLVVLRTCTGGALGMALLARAGGVDVVAVRTLGQTVAVGAEEVRVPAFGAAQLRGALAAVLGGYIDGWLRLGTGGSSG